MLTRQLIAIGLATILCFFNLTIAQKRFVQVGKASYYHHKFTGRKTANGERYWPELYTCAHRKLPFNTKLKVTNPVTGEWIIVKVNDRGPFHKKRVIDLSYVAAARLGMIKKGDLRVKVEFAHDSLVPVFEQKVLNEEPSFHSEAAKVLASRKTYRPGCIYNETGKTATVKGYGLQINTFKKFVNARISCEKLQAQGFNNILIQPFNKNGKLLYRVLIGPWQGFEDAQIQSEEFGRSGIANCVTKIG
jgi:rare lipoprotein A